MATTTPGTMTPDTNDCCPVCGEHFSDPHAPGCANTPADEEFDTEGGTATSGGRSTHSST